MRCAINEKWQMTHNGRRRTTKSSCNQNARGIGNLHTCEYWKLTPSNKWKWKKEFKREYLRGIRKLLETKFYSRNLVKGINIWDVPLLIYSEPFLLCTREELKQMDQRTRKLMTMHKALHPRDDVDRLYVSIRERGRRLSTIEVSVDASIQRLEGYMEKRRGRLITATRNNTNDTRTSRKTITRKQKWEEKQLYGGFKRLTSDISQEKTWTWLRKGNL